MAAGGRSSKAFARRALCLETCTLSPAGLQEDGSYAGFDPAEFTSRSGGKATAIEQIKARSCHAASRAHTCACHARLCPAACALPGCPDRGHPALALHPARSPPMPSAGPARLLHHCDGGRRRNRHGGTPARCRRPPLPQTCLPAHPPARHPPAGRPRACGRIAPRPCCPAATVVQPAGAADMFIGYGGVVERANIAAAADWYVYQIQPLIDAL